MGNEEDGRSLGRRLQESQFAILWINSDLGSSNRMSNACCFMKTNPRSFLFSGCSLNIAAAMCLFTISITNSSGGYAIKSKVQTEADRYHYTWVVYNQDQSFGLDGFIIEIPAETRVLSHTVPRPYSDTDGHARWTLNETLEAQVCLQDGQTWLPAARPGKKWLKWWGEQPASVYPAGTAVAFSITTDTTVAPGPVQGTSTTFTPDNNPHFYFALHGGVMGPSAVMSDRNTPNSSTNTRTVDAYYYSLLSTNAHECITNALSGPIDSATRLEVAMYAGTKIEGVLGQTYGIQYNTDLSDADTWRGLANVTLTAPNLFWIDPEPAGGSQRYYRVVPGPITIP